MLPRQRRNRQSHVLAAPQSASLNGSIWINGGLLLPGAPRTAISQLRSDSGEKLAIVVCALELECRIFVGICKMTR
jgi:hypothetical protein